MSEIAVSEGVLSEERLRTEVHSLTQEYRGVLLKSPLVQRAIALSFFGPGQDNQGNGEKAVRFRVDDQHDLAVSYDHNKNLSVDWIGKGETYTVILDQEASTIKYSYKNDDGRIRERNYENNIDATGQARHLLGSLQSHLPSVTR